MWGGGVGVRGRGGGPSLRYNAAKMPPNASSRALPREPPGCGLAPGQGRMGMSAER